MPPSPCTPLTHRELLSPCPPHTTPLPTTRNPNLTVQSDPCPLFPIGPPAPPPTYGGQSHLLAFIDDHLHPPSAPARQLPLLIASLLAFPADHHDHLVATAASSLASAFSMPLSDHLQGRVIPLPLSHGARSSRLGQSARDPPRP
ncbi:hypothetical protein ZWY2020_028900 [Hordeum vulgare]|nr:hypothetical protein ZWY2020_028900 [Hordeum vulgare]